MIRPSKLRIEAMSSCQLRCPTCPTTTGEIRPVIPAGYLRVEHLARLLEQNPRIRHVELSNFGEILLSPDFLAILKLGQDLGVGLSADNGLNLNTATEEQLEGMVKYGFRSATISIDGASQETYEKHRVKGDLDRVLGNIKSINAYKQRFGTERPVLAWQFVIFGHNEHELERARALAAELGMDFRPKLSYESEFAPVRNEAAVKRALGVNAASRDEYEDRYGENYSRAICHQLWTEPQVNWDGKVLGCCSNYWGDFGANAFTDGLEEALNSERLQYARQMLLGKTPPREDIPCTVCPKYASLQRSKDWLTLREVLLRDSRIMRIMRALAKATGVSRLRRRATK